MCIGFAYVGVSVVLFLVGRFSPYEWHIDTSGAEASMRNEFSVWNSLWFSFSTLMQQGCEVAPRAVSSRIVASVWYLFTLIIISSYTANLAAFLTSARMNSPINSVEDLAQQTAIKYGTLRGGSTKSYFKNSNYPTYKKMWAFMERNPDVFCANNDAGVERVRSSNGRYAFLIESTNNKYISNREPCNTMKVGANLNTQGYGIGMPLDSDLKSKVNIAILQLRERGVLTDLEKKWWSEVGNICPDQSNDASSTSRLPMTKIEGVFHILAAGITTGIVIAVLELFYNSKIDAIKSDDSLTFKEALRSHLTLCWYGAGDSDSNEKHDGPAPQPDQSDEGDGTTAKSIDKSNFLAVDDVFHPSAAHPQPVVTAPSLKYRAPAYATSSSPVELRLSHLKNSTSANSTSGLLGRDVCAVVVSEPPEEFRDGGEVHWATHTTV